MKILVSGASGLVGSALVKQLTTEGHQVSSLVRRQATHDEITWDPAAGELDGGALTDFEAVIHLAGESIASGRWSSAKKQRIESSRVRGTRLIAETLANLEKPPAVLIAASAIGIYGDRGDEWLQEGSEPGEGFLAGVCQRWEAATASAREAGLRVVNLRIGVVLDAGGGALAQMRTPFRLGLGGAVGSGRQWMSWISLEDLVGTILHVLTSDHHGALNAVAPHPLRQRQLATALGRELGRPTFLPLPAWAARLAFGEMADELLLASTRVDGRQLQKLGYTFRHPELSGALEHLLGG